MGIARRAFLFGSTIVTVHSPALASLVLSRALGYPDVGQKFGNADRDRVRNRRVLRSFDAFSLAPADDDDPEEAENPSEEGP